MINIDHNDERTFNYMTDLLNSPNNTDKSQFSYSVSYFDIS